VKLLGLIGKSCPQWPSDNPEGRRPATAMTARQADSKKKKSGRPRPNGPSPSYRGRPTMTAALTFGQGRPWIKRDLERRGGGISGGPTGALAGIGRGRMLFAGGEPGTTARCGGRSLANGAVNWMGRLAGDGRPEGCGRNATIPGAQPIRTRGRRGLSATGAFPNSPTPFTAHDRSRQCGGQNSRI